MFSFLNRSDRPVITRVRDLLETWFLRYPASEQADMRGRFRSKDDLQHYSAFHELFLHALLLQLGCAVEIHPRLPGSETTRPDFRVTCRNGSSFFLEAIPTSGQSGEERAALARMNDVYDALNRLESPNFFIGLEILGSPDTPPRASYIRRSLRKNLDRLDPDDIAELWEFDPEAIPRWRYEHDGWVLRAYPIPKSEEARGDSDVRPIGVWSPLGGFPEIRPEEAIRKAILAKVGRYGNLQLPYVIAANLRTELPSSRSDVLDALFGDGQIVVSRRKKDGQNQTSRIKRAGNGVWASNSGPQNQGVSAVLVTHSIDYFNLANADVCLYHNPWATRPYDTAMTRLSEATVKEDPEIIDWQEGESLAELLGLPDNWPRVEL